MVINYWKLKETQWDALSRRSTNSDIKISSIYWETGFYGLTLFIIFITFILFWLSQNLINTCDILVWIITSPNSPFLHICATSIIDIWRTIKVCKRCFHFEKICELNLFRIHCLFSNTEIINVNQTSNINESIHLQIQTIILIAFHHQHLWAKPKI